MALNTSYGLEPEKYVQGMVTDSRIGFTTVTKITNAKIGAGILVKKNSANSMVVPPSTQGDYIIGATRWTPTMVQGDDGEDAYRAKSAVPVVTEGPVVLMAAEAIGVYDPVYAVISGGGQNSGKVKKTSGADTTKLPIGRAETAASGDGKLLLVYLRPAMQTPQAAAAAAAL